MKKQFFYSFIVFFIFLLFFIGFSISRPKIMEHGMQTSFLGFETVNSDTINYLDRLSFDEPFALDLKTPVQFFLTRFALFFFSIDTVLWLFPFLTFFGFLLTLFYIFYEFELNPLLILFTLSWKITWIVHFFNYDRDNWVLLFFGLFFLGILQVHFFKKQKYWFLIFLMAFLAIFTKSIGIYFLGMALIFVVYKFLEKRALKLRGIILIPVTGLFSDYLFGLRNTEILTANSFSAFFGSPIHFLGVFGGLLFLKDNFLKIMLVSVVLTGHTLFNFGFSLSTIYKYLFFISPLTITVIAMVFKTFKGKNGLISKKQLFFLLVVSLFFNLSNVGRLAGNIFP